MEGIHELLAWLTVASTVAVLLAAFPGAFGRPAGRLWVDRAVLVQVGCATVTLVAGLVVTIAKGGPADWLHFVYAIVVVGVVPAARYAAHGQTERRFAGWIAVAALIAMGALLRSFMTGH